MKNRVRIGTCSGPAEAAFVRSVFDAHDLPVVINGEMHASAMGGLGGFVRLDIFVDGDDAEEAAALLGDIRAGDHAVSEDDAAPDASEGDERADADGVWNVEHGAGALEVSPASPPATPTTGFDNRRRRTGIILLLSVMPGFGAAHMATGAWGRGIAIAAVNVLGVKYVVTGQTVLGGWLLFGARFADLLGALWRVWSRPGGDAGPRSHRDP